MDHSVDTLQRLVESLWAKFPQTPMCQPVAELSLQSSLSTGVVVKQITAALAQRFELANALGLALGWGH
jgi:hypothetical protein